MTLNDLYLALASIEGFSQKVVYRAWPVGSAPPLPWIVYLVDGTDNFGADNIVYKSINRIFIELYSEYKDETSESLIEGKLDSLGIYWEKEETYIDEERCYQITYTIEVANG